MTRPARIAWVLPVLLSLVAGSIAADQSSKAQDEDTIWKLEQSIYAGGSGHSNLTNYLGSMDPEYAGWPPQSAAPLGYAHIAEAARNSSGASVALTMKKDLIRVHREGNVALAFYTTHRTGRAGGAADDYFETLHVWIRGQDGTWKLFGAMVRSAPATRPQAKP